MRVFEWAVVVSFFPMLGLPWIPLSWRRRWFVGAGVLLVLGTVLHLVVEGWRIQMVPLYGLGLLVVGGRLPIMFRENPTMRRGRAFMASGITALLLGGGAVLAGWVLPVVHVSEPTGPYSVGIIDRELVDPERGRRLMVSVWYPSSQRGIPTPMTHYPDEVMQGLGASFGVPALAFQHLRYFTVAASEHVPLLEQQAPLPVLVFSHGLVGLRLQSSPLLQELASWGYVVVAIDHTDAAAISVFPDGEARPFDLERFGITPADGEVTQAMLTEHMVPVWVADQQFVFDTLEDWAVDDPLLAGRIDPAQIGAFGHSFGGATALEVCRIDSRCRAAVNLDGALYGTSVTEPAVRPVLLMSSAASNDIPEAIATWGGMMARAEAPAYWLEVPKSNHYSFTIVQFISPLLVSDGFEPEVGLQQINTYLRSFFDAHVRGVASIPLGPLSNADDVRWRIK